MIVKSKFLAILEALRKGKSLYAACCFNHVTTRDFYQLIHKNVELKDDYLLALSDYADQCTDDIRELASALQTGDIDTSSAKLLIETKKYLAQKACPTPYINPDDITDTAETKEIVVKFV